MTQSVRECLLVVLMAGLCGAIGSDARAQARRPAVRPAGVSPAAPARAGQDAPRAGWWIRVNPNNEAANLYWRFGAAANRLSAPIDWKRGTDPEVIELPATQRMLPSLEVAALGMPPTAHVSFCVFFQDHGVALFDFVREKNASLKQAQRDPACMP